MSLTLVQAPSGPVADLWVHSMGDLQPELRRGAPKDCIVYQYCGAGTSHYEHPPSLEEVILRFPPLGKQAYRHVAITGWSAGGRAVQRQLDVAFKNGRCVPDAVLLADALYAPLVRGKVDVRPLASVLEFAVRAATEPGRIFAMWHSAIATPGYASSSQCADSLRAGVEARLGTTLTTFVPPSLDGRPVLNALRRGNFILLEYAGNGKTEHLAEAHMLDEAMRAFVPWASPDCKTAIGEWTCFPEVATPPQALPMELGGSRFAQALVMAARADVGIHEEGGANRGPHVDAYLQSVGLSPGAEWCGAAVTTWLREASALTGLDLPVNGSAAAKAFVAQFQAAGKWIPRRALAGKVQPGMILVWDRGGWKGHVGVVESVSADGVHTIEANSGPACDAVVRNVRQLSDPMLLGGGAV